MLWFTADTHFTHTNILTYCNRPFKSINQHDDILVNNWNSVVKKGDTVYHLGDVGFSYNKPQEAERLKRILGKLAGNIILIKGNHDGQHTLCMKRFNVVKDVHLIKQKDIKIFMSHYAHRTWPFSLKGGIHLFGHSHGKLPPFGKSFDVGVDSWKYTPVSLPEVIEYSKTLVVPDFNKEEKYILD